MASCPVCQHQTRILFRGIRPWRCPTCASLLRLGSPSHVPHPALVLLFLLFPFLCEIEVVQRSGNYCHRCGYNLSGSAGGVCPECGVKFGPPASR